MTDDEIDALHAKLRRARAPFDEAQAQAIDLTNRLKRVLGGLEKKDYSSNSKIVRPGFKPGVSTWVEELPTQEEMLDVLTRWYEAREVLRSSYAALPEVERKHIVDLPIASQGNT